jgi:segregation and condensation protein A
MIQKNNMEYPKQTDYLPNITDVTLGSSLARIRARGKFNKVDVEDFIPTAESPLLYIDTPLYDGPLDLLLHLIRKHSMDIFDIPIVTITKKYLEALEDMETLNLDIAGEFLVMAATLADIKSKMLLPKEEQILENEEEGEDPRAGLIRRLLLYKSFQEASLELLNKPHLGESWFYRPSNDSDEQALEYHENKSIVPLEINELLSSLTLALKKSESIEVHSVIKDRISVSARLRELIDYCQLRSNFTFYDAVKFFPLHEKLDIIITFLALLEMAKLHLIKLHHDPQCDLKINTIKDRFYTDKQEILHNLSSDQNEDEYD